MFNIGLIGYGYWGPNLLRNFIDTERLNLIKVFDLNSEKINNIKIKYSNVLIANNIDEIIKSKDINAVVIATPPSTHFELAFKALNNGKHVLVEKPLATSSSECKQLISEAKRKNLVLMVDHTFTYTGAVKKIKELMKSNELGKLFYFDSVRVNLGSFQSDVNVIWDLAVHDLSILDFLLEKIPTTVSAIGMSHIKGQTENIAYITLLFKENIIAHIHVNWLSPVKVRKTLIGFSDKMLVYDDLEFDEKIKIYDRGVVNSKEENSNYNLKVDYRTGDMIALLIERTEALKNTSNHFLDCIENREQPITDGYSGLRVVKILEAIDISLKNNGKPTAIQ